MFDESNVAGATVVGLTFKDGVILGAEKRFSYRGFVVSRTGKKVFKITDYVGVAAAGMIADMQVLIRQIISEIKIKELELRRPLAPNAIAKLMSVILFERRYAPLLTQVVIGGISDKPSIYVLDPLGSVVPDVYAAVGTGAEMAIGVVEAGFKPDMSEKDAKELAIRSIKAGIQRDAASGDGVDIMIITANGIKEESTIF